MLQYCGKGRKRNIIEIMHLFSWLHGIVTMLMSKLNNLKSFSKNVVQFYAFLFINNYFSN